ncbi:MAG: tetratricopeptide repeat protein [Bacteroidales bacterium]|nr:tetratricopeptide repeat protein [Bacteroidales bacterium]
MEFIRKSIVLAVFTIIMTGLQAQNTEKVQEAFIDSYSCETNANYTDAINILKNVYDPASYHINTRLGWLCYISGQFTESAAYYQKAIELKPYAIEARFGLTYPASSMGNWAQVKNQYIKILELDPQNTKANYYFGLMLYESGDYGLAAKHFEKVVNLFPFDSKSVLMFGWANFQLGKTREAEVLFREVLIIEPNNESALEGLELIK